MKVKKALCFCIGMLLLFSGCGSKGSAGQTQGKEDTGANTETVGADTEETRVFYSYSETALPDIEKALPELEGGYVYDRFGILVQEGKIYRPVKMLKQDVIYVVQHSYIQEYDDSGEGAADWKIREMPKEITMEDKFYSGMAGPYFFRQGGTSFGFSYDEDTEKYYPADTNGLQVMENGTGFTPQEIYDLEDNATWCDYEGNSYLYEEGTFSYTTFDAEFSQMETKELNGRVYGFLQEKEGSPVYWYGLGTNNKLCVRDVESGQALVENREVSNMFTAAMAKDGTLYVADTNGIYLCGEEMQEIYRLKEDYPFDALYGMYISDNGDIHIVAELDNAMVIMNFQKLDEPRTLSREEITIGFLNNHVALQKSIARFNRQSDKYRVVLTYEDKVDGPYKPYQDDMKLSVSTGGGPDIIGSDMIDDIEPYVKNGYLECLDDLKPTEGEYEEAAFESCRVDGKMYGIPYEYHLSVVIYNRDLVGDKKSLTVEELMEAVEKSDAKILQPGLCGEYIVYYYALFDDDNTAYIDWKQGKSHLTEQAFLDVLAFAKKYEDTGEYGSSETELLQSGTAFCKNINYMEDFIFWDEAYSDFNGRPAALGYPRSSGNGYYTTGRELYLNANSQHKEGAREFMRYLITEEEQVRYAQYDTYKEMERLGSGSVYGYKCQFPVSMTALDVIVEKKIADDKNNYFVDENGTVYGKKPIDEAQIEQFYYVIQNAKPGNTNIVPLLDVVWEELEPYFNGECSAEEAAAKLDNRVQLYLDER